jgi:hypothetical protein
MVARNRNNLLTFQTKHLSERFKFLKNLHSSFITPVTLSSKISGNNTPQEPETALRLGARCPVGRNGVERNSLETVIAGIRFEEARSFQSSRNMRTCQ